MAAGMKRRVARAVGFVILLVALVVPAAAIARDRDHDHMRDSWEKKHHLSVHKANGRRDADGGLGRLAHDAGQRLDLVQGPVAEEGQRHVQGARADRAQRRVRGRGGPLLERLPGLADSAGEPSRPGREGGGVGADPRPHGLQP